MVAITTKYFGPTNFKGSRIKASANGNSVTIGFDYALGSEERHAKAARALCDKMGWKNKLIAGGLDAGNYVFVMVPKDCNVGDVTTY
jgi:hypothetical protein